MQGAAGTGLKEKEAKSHLWVFLRGPQMSVLKTQILGVDPPNSDSFGGGGGTGASGTCLFNTDSDRVDAGGPRPAPRKHQAVL